MKSILPNKNPKRKIATLLPLLAAMIAKAWVEIFLFVIIVVIVAGTIFAILYKATKAIIPPPYATTNDVSYGYQYQDQMPSIQTRPLLTPLDNLVPPPGHTLQYGVAATNAAAGPWLVRGNALVQDPAAQATAQQMYGTVCELENDENCYDFLTASAGYLSRFTWTASNDTLITTTNLIGIERCSDLGAGDWQMLYTNSFFSLNTVYTWTDTNPPAGNCFYRARYLNVPDMVDTNSDQ